MNIRLSFECVKSNKIQIDSEPHTTPILNWLLPKQMRNDWKAIVKNMRTREEKKIACENQIFMLI